jgi:hypothetical protein
MTDDWRVNRVLKVPYLRLSWSFSGMEERLSGQISDSYLFAAGAAAGASRGLVYWPGPAC